MWGGGRVKGARSGRIFRFFGIFLFARSNGLGSFFHAVAIESGREGEVGTDPIGRSDWEIAGEIAVDRRWAESAFTAVCVARFSLSGGGRRCLRIDVDSSDVKIVSQSCRGGPCGPPPRVRCLAGGLAVWPRWWKAWRKSLPHRTILNAMIPMVLKSEVTEFRCF
jgi:hypothetical protein